MSSRGVGAAAPGVLRRLIREPLVHFLLIGAVLFAGISLAKSLNRPTVRIDAREVEQLAAYWAQQTERQPTRAELDAIIRERVDEEVLAREAVRLGLDRDDIIVRRRLAQKMAFAGEDAAAVEPDEATLRAYFRRTQASYAGPARITLRQVFFSRDRTGVRPQIAAAEALADLRAGRAVGGDPSLLPTTYADAGVDDLARDFGPAFVTAAQGAPVGGWVGPVESPYGVHLLRVERRRPPEAPAFDAVKADVRAAWMAERRQAANAAYLQRLRARYRVVVAGVTP